MSSFRQAHGYIDEEHLTGAGRPLAFNQNYDCSKLLLTSFTTELARRLEGTGNCLLYYLYHFPAPPPSLSHLIPTCLGLGHEILSVWPKPAVNLLHYHPHFIFLSTPSLHLLFNLFQLSYVHTIPLLLVSISQYQHHLSWSS